VTPLFTEGSREKTAFMCIPRAEKSKNYDKETDSLNLTDGLLRNRQERRREERQDHE